MNNKGQISLEYILMIGIIVIILISAIQVLYLESEKNSILAAAQIGLQTGVDKNAYAMYYNDTFNTYGEDYPKLLYPTEIKVIGINITREENRIYLQAKLHSNHYLTVKQREIIGHRVNYYIRKTVSETFNQENPDLFYENCRSNNYNIETKKVKWID